MRADIVGLEEPLERYTGRSGPLQLLVIGGSLGAQALNETLPLALEGRDVAGQAQTGTGKTAAFLVTVITRLLSLNGKNNGQPSAIIIAPTRELSRQIYEEARIIARHTELSLAQIVGGVDYLKQAETLRRGTDIIICTPGRIIDYYKQGIFKAEGIKVLVIDEADRLLVETEEAAALHACHAAAVQGVIPLGESAGGRDQATPCRAAAVTR